MIPKSAPASEVERNTVQGNTPLKEADSDCKKHYEDHPYHQINHEYGFNLENEIVRKLIETYDQEIR